MNKKAIKLGLILVWMVVIFIFSSQKGEDSSQTSQWALHIMENLGFPMESLFGQLAEFVVRKAAHMTEYFILACLLFSYIKDVKPKSAYVLTLVIVFLYACTDEFHQLFVPLRTGRFEDVLIDTSGAILSLIVLFIIQKRLKITRKRNVHNKGF